MAVKSTLVDLWSATKFRSADLDGYAEQQMCADVRQGVRIMALLSLAMQCVSAVFAWYVGAGSSYLYTNVVLGALSVHIFISARYVKDVQALQVLGMILLLVTALAISFLAHRNGDLQIGMMAAIIMLFIAIPLVPWALREAVIVIGLTYGLLTLSLLSVPGRFDAEALVALHLLVAGAAIVALVVIARNTRIRKQDIRTQFELERAHREMETLSMRDHLTGAWNRRYLDQRFPSVVQRCKEEGKTLHIAVLDIDDFKGINDQFGHQVGDEILSALGQIFTEMLGDKGWFVRLGGDEFQVFYCGDNPQGLVGRAVAQLHETDIARTLDGRRVITLSAGFTSTDFENPVDLDALYQEADAALYDAKRGNTSPVEVGDNTGTWQL